MQNYFLLMSYIHRNKNDINDNVTDKVKWGLVV